ncbi:MAG: hypothetical protein NTY74_04220 [Ignavibacteriae bacterium]|nr:hypothetical protein [Ignavibacteriota bacterium]
MLRYILVIFIFLLTSIYSFGQFSEQIITTDSSNIKINRNSFYHIYKESYKDKDSIWYSVHFIKDTTRLCEEGWMRKNGQKIGIWQEYNFERQLLYTWDHNKGFLEVNKPLYPYHEVLEKMKIKVDSLIISSYSQEFYDNHVKFDFECYAYYDHWETFDNEREWISDYVGSWTEQMTNKPNSFQFRYQLRLQKSDDESIEMRITLDSLGNYVASSDDHWSNYGFEDVKGDKKTFNICTDTAFEIAKHKGLIVTDSSSVSGFLIWENFKKQTFYNGQFRYYIIEFKGKTEYNAGQDREGIINKYNVYSFNPWTGDFIEKKKMKTKQEKGKHSGFRTGLLPDND